MYIEIGNKIRQLRGRRHVTQEQLAVFLGVTPQAISRWEAGNGYPDIESLPMIAEYFAVTTDELLGVKKEEREARLAEIYAEIDRQNEMAICDEGTLTFARNAAAEFPSEVKLQLNLADTICCLYMWESSRDESKLTEAEKIYEAVIENCTDADMKNNVLESLCSLYANGFRDEKKARRTAERLPAMKYAREQVMANAMLPVDDPRGVYYRQDYLDRLADSLGIAMRDMVIGQNVDNGRDTWEKKLRMLDSVIALYHLVYGDDLNCLHGRVAYAYRIKATYYIAMDRAEETLEALEKMCEHSVKCSASKAGDRFTSPFTDQLTQPEPGEDFDWYTVHNDAFYTLQKMEQSRYDSIRDTVRFQEIIRKLTAAAR